MRDKAQMASIDESKQFVPLNIAVLTVSGADGFRHALAGG